MGENPFADQPPRFIRASLYKYHFTSRDKNDEQRSELESTSLNIISQSYTMARKTVKTSTRKSVAVVDARCDKRHGPLSSLTQSPFSELNTIQYDMLQYAYVRL